jgi:hypothetical protein
VKKKEIIMNTNSNYISEFEELNKLYDLLDKVTNAYDALFRMEADNAPGMDISIMDKDHFRPAIENLVEHWEDFKKK